MSKTNIIRRMATEVVTNEYILKINDEFMEGFNDYIHERSEEIKRIFNINTEEVSYDIDTFISAYTDINDSLYEVIIDYVNDALLSQDYEVIDSYVDYVDDRLEVIED